MKKNRLLSLAVAVMMTLCFILPLQTLAAKPGETVSEQLTISAGEAFHLVYVEYKLSDGLEFVSINSTWGKPIYNTTTGKAIAYDPAMGPGSSGATSVTFTVEAKVKDGVTTDQNITFSNVQYISNALRPSGDLSKVIPIGGGVKYDMNGDLELTMRDALIVMYSYLDGKTVADMPQADVNNDGEITMRDALIIMYAYLDA